MNKTILRNIHLVNWYGFSNRTIPVSENLTLISGENECGKSTILDAVKYAYTGDTQFNKATSGYNTGVGKRNLVSYTRCLVDASSGIYARPADKIPVVYTHIEVAEKQRFIDSLKEEIQGCRDNLIGENTLLKKELERVQSECVEQTMKLKRFYNKKVNIVTKEGIAFSGVVTEYFYPEENESGNN